MAVSQLTPLTELRTACQERLRDGAATLDEHAARQLLGDALPFGEAIDCADPAEVAVAAERIGGPVVVKALTPVLLHKSEHGLVRPGCGDAEQARAAAEELVASVASAAPGAPYVLSVQRQLSGVELAVGVHRDRLGAIVLVSAGGTLIELLDDNAVALAPVSREEASELVGRLRSAPLLDGYRGAEPADRAALERLVHDVAAIAAAIPEIVELDLNPVFVGPGGAAVADARVVLAEPDEPERSRPVDAATMARLLDPSAIAVIGASADASKIGGRTLRYLRENGFAGRLVGINARGAEIDGVETHRSIADASGQIDLACIAVPAPAVPGVVAECAAAAVPFAVVLSAGFAEAGPGGAELQARTLEAAGDVVRLIGPNTNGIASPPSGVYATFGMALERDVPAGRIAFISQSGAIASSLMSRAREFGVGFSRWIAVGNEADLDVADFLSALADDSTTDVACIFLEAVRRPLAFAAACERMAAAGKPVVALKAGRSDAGAAAALSHTGAMTGSDRAYQAYLRRCGVVVVDELPSLLTAAEALSSIGTLAGRRAVVVSMSGGACSLLADACEAAAIEVPELSDETRRRLREVVPEFGGVRNPIDVTAVGIGSPELVRRTLEVLRTADEADVILLQLSTNADPGAEHIARDVIALREQPGVPLLVGRLGSPALAPRAVAAYQEAGVHVLTWPGQLVEAARACIESGDLLRRPTSLEPSWT
jgi:acyl-CoA synthetase (NDP forming)